MNAKDEMFNYLTEPDNYELANDLTNRLIEVNQRLRFNFLNDLKVKIKNKFVENQKWKIDDCNNNDNILLDISKSNWKDYWLTVGIEKTIDYGLRIDPAKVDIKTIDCCRNKFSNLDFGKDSTEYWPFWESINIINFELNEYKDLLRILPKNIKNLQDDIADKILIFAQKYEEFFDEIVKK